MKKCLIFVLAAVATLSVGCGGKRAGSNDTKPVDNFLADSDLDAIRGALKYACDSKTDNKEITSDSKECRSKEDEILKNKDLKVKFIWSCTQTDVIKNNRKIPSRAEFELPVKLEFKDGLVVADIKFEPIKEFLEKTKLEPNSYRSCVFDFKDQEGFKIFNTLNVKGNFDCKLSEFWGKSYKSNLQVYLDGLLKELDEKESKEIIRPLFMPNYDKIEESSDREPTQSCDNGVFRTHPDEGYTRFSSDAQFMMSKSYLQNRLPEVFKTKPNCVYRLITVLHPENHISEKCSANPENIICKQQIENYIETLNAVEKAVKGTNSKELSRQFLDVRYDLAKFGSIYENWLHEISNSKDESSSCEPLPVGNSRLVNSPAPLSQYSYRIKRPSEKINEVEINVAFIPDCASTEFENKKISTLWYKRVNDCLTKVAPYMKTLDGQQIHLKLISSSAYDAPRANYISVTNDEATFRESAGRYSIRTSCSVIVHEVLHLTGLVDEYRETDVENNYSCRSGGPTDSIMHFHEAAFDKTVRTRLSLLKPAHARRILYPNCEEKSGIYNRCALDAYKSEMCSNDKPPECRNGSMFWIER